MKKNWLGSVLCFALLLVGSGDTEAQMPQASPGDWPFWRGPSLNGTAEAGQHPPIEWSDSKNVAWKREIPGRGHSSPIIVGQRVLLTTAEGDAQRQSVLCYHRETGELLWRRDIHQDGLPGQIHRQNSHASCTISVHDGRLFAAFYHRDGIYITALTLDGELLWTSKAGTFQPQQFKFGYGASPVLYGDMVIVAGDHDAKAFLTALDQETGKTVWYTNRPSKINFASPVVAHVAGRDQLLISGCDLVASYDPRNGKSIWQVAATTMSTVGTIVWQDDLVFAAGGYPEPGAVCIRADGSGEVLWENNAQLYEQSMLVHDGQVYAMADSGTVFCWQALTGREQWRERLRGPVSASPVLAGGNIYISNQRGTTWVFRATPERFQGVAENQLGSEALATPSICGNEIFIRVADRAGRNRREWLYCIKGHNSSQFPR